LKLTNLSQQKNGQYLKVRVYLSVSSRLRSRKVRT